MEPFHLLFEEEKEIFHQSEHNAPKHREANILIVDDQLFLLDVLKMILEDQGLGADTALGGKQAI